MLNLLYVEIYNCEYGACVSVPRCIESSEKMFSKENELEKAGDYFPL
jgi:hypothetical protein